MLQKIKLHGILKDKFGESVELQANSVKQALKALNANFKEFKEILRKYDFAILADGVSLGIKDLSCQGLKFKQLDIIPVTSGEGGENNIIKDIVGGLEIAVGIVLDIYSYGTIGNPLIAMGVSTIAGSVISSFMKPPQYDQSADAASSNIFDGARNVSKEGIAVPIIYGEMIVGSLVASGFIAVQGQKI
jgi:predicted phage tail protein